MSRERIRELNDAFRVKFTEGLVVMTPGVSALSERDKHEVLELVRKFDDFHEGSDPHGEHDMGFFEYAGTRYMWVISYYDENLESGSNEPDNPDGTTRVLTIMRGRENGTAALQRDDLRLTGKVVENNDLTPRLHKVIDGVCQSVHQPCFKTPSAHTHSPSTRSSAASADGSIAAHMATTRGTAPIAAWRESP